MPNQHLAERRTVAWHEAFEAGERMTQHMLGDVTHRQFWPYSATTPVPDLAGLVREDQIAGLADRRQITAYQSTVWGARDVLPAASRY
jgi:hypothetical protein